MADKELVLLMKIQRFSCMWKRNKLMHTSCWTYVQTYGSLCKSSIHNCLFIFKNCPMKKSTSFCVGHLQFSGTIKVEADITETGRKVWVVKFNKFY